MKKILFFIITTHTLVINAQENNLDKNIVNTLIGRIDNHDLDCLSQIAKAKIDFKSEEIYYDIVSEGYINQDSNRHHTFLNDLLKQKGIRFLMSPEVELPSYYEENNSERYPLLTNCYYKACNELLNLKYGKNFTKNIEKTADSLYVISRINDGFQYPNEVDEYCIIYPKASEFLDQKIEIQKDFFLAFKFPNGFTQSDDKRDFIAKTKFTIKKDSKISDIKIEVEFKNPENQKFNDYFVSKLTTFIENANWKAAVSAGIEVNCLFEMNFYN